MHELASVVETGFALPCMDILHYIILKILFAIKLSSHFYLDDRPNNFVVAFVICFFVGAKEWSLPCCPLALEGTSDVPICDSRDIEGYFPVTHFQPRYHGHYVRHCPSKMVWLVNVWVLFRTRFYHV